MTAVLSRLFLFASLAASLFVGLLVKPQLRSRRAIRTAPSPSW